MSDPECKINKDRVYHPACGYMFKCMKTPKYFTEETSHILEYDSDEFKNTKRNRGYYL